MPTSEEVREIELRVAVDYACPDAPGFRDSLKTRRDVAALLEDRAEMQAEIEQWKERWSKAASDYESVSVMSVHLQAEIERLMTRNEELARAVDRYTGTDYMERLHAVARAAQEIVYGLPYRGVRDFPELREELRCLKALEADHD